MCRFSALVLEIAVKFNTLLAQTYTHYTFLINTVFVLKIHGIASTSSGLNKSIHTLSALCLGGTMVRLRRDTKGLWKALCSLCVVLWFTTCVCFPLIREKGCKYITYDPGRKKSSSMPLSVLLFVVEFVSFMRINPSFMRINPSKAKLH